MNRLRRPVPDTEAPRESEKGLGTGSCGHLGRKQLVLPKSVWRASWRRKTWNLKSE